MVVVVVMMAVVVLDEKSCGEAHYYEAVGKDSRNVGCVDEMSTREAQNKDSACGRPWEKYGALRDAPSG